MGVRKKPIVEKTERRWVDPVTNEFHVLKLDAKQKALERVHAALDREMLQLSTEDNAWLVAGVLDLLAGMVSHT